MNLQGLKTAAPKKAKAEKPPLPDPTGALTPLVDDGIRAKQNIEAHTAVLDTIKAKLGSAALQHLFSAYQGMGKVEDTFKLAGANGSVMVSIKNAYKLPEDLESVRAVLGTQAERFLKETFVIEVDSEAIPAQIQQFFVDELVKLARACDDVLGHEGEGPVFGALTVRKITAMDKAFHEERLRLFSAEENQRIHQVAPCIVSSRFDY